MTTAKEETAGTEEKPIEEARKDIETEYRKEIETAEEAEEAKEAKETEKTALPKKKPAESPKPPVESPKSPVESPKSPVESPKSPVESPKTLEEMIDSEELHSIRERIAKLENDVIRLYEKVDTAPVAGVAGTDIDELITRINDIQAEMEKLSQTADRLIDDRESREMHLNVSTFIILSVIVLQYIFQLVSLLVLFPNFILYFNRFFSAPFYPFVYFRLFHI